MSNYQHNALLRPLHSLPSVYLRGQGDIILLVLETPHNLLSLHQHRLRLYTHQNLFFFQQLLSSTELPEGKRNITKNLQCHFFVICFSTVCLFVIIIRRHLHGNIKIMIPASLKLYRQMSVE